MRDLMLFKMGVSVAEGSVFTPAAAKGLVGTRTKITAPGYEDADVVIVGAQVIGRGAGIEITIDLPDDAAIADLVWSACAPLTGISLGEIP